MYPTQILNLLMAPLQHFQFIVKVQIRTYKRLRQSFTVDNLLQQYGIVQRIKNNTQIPINSIFSSSFPNYKPVEYIVFLQIINAESQFAFNNQITLKTSNNRKSVMKGKHIWTPQEDQCLKSLVFSSPEYNNWIMIAEKLNLFFENQIRSAKQCRERYSNYISLNDGHFSDNNWTIQQTQSLFHLFQMWGSRWTKISQQIKGKSENCVKNRFSGSLRKALRKMNRASKNLLKKFKKQVKYDSITRIIEASEGLYRLQSPLKEESEELTKKILNLAQKQDDQMVPEQASDLIIQINKFNMATRSYKSKRRIKNTKINAQKQEIKGCLMKKETLCSGSEKQDYVYEQLDENIQNHGSSTDQENTKIIAKYQGKKDFQQEHEELKDFSDWQAIKLHRKQSAQQLDDYFLEAQSPLEGQAWI